MPADDPLSNLTFHAPPGWPPPPRGWRPPPEWKPDPSWPPPPPGWVFWRPAEAGPTAPPPPPPPAVQFAIGEAPADAGIADRSSDPVGPASVKEQPVKEQPEVTAEPGPTRKRGLPRRRIVLIAAAAVVVIGLATIGLVVVLADPCKSLKPGADLTECDFTGRDLAGTDLTGATLIRAVLRTANLAGAVLAGSDLSEADLSGADLTGAKIESATADGASLAGAHLDHAVLTDAELDGADLTEASLIGATLTGAGLTRANLKNAEISGAVLSDADLSEADLSGASLSGAVLAGAQLARARLDEADLTGADLTRADLSSSTLVGALLRRGELQDVVGLTDEMLASALGVGEVDLAAEALRQELHFDDTMSIIAAVAPAVTGSGVQGTHAYADTPAFHPLVVLGQGGAALTPDWAAGVQGLWMPEALRFVELVAVTEPGREVVEDCGMYVNSVTLEETGHLVRYRETIGVRVYSATTGQLVAAQVFRGPDPRACSPTNETTAAILDGLWGDPADYSALIPWLSGIVHPPVDVTGAGAGSVNWDPGERG